ncbi:hypothetical protein SLEP1_g19417 [Rubroshorea leprosula]|nr:hypothetical protein SLEP1_g19417 [Rubroshorea leprosula]
MEVVSLVVAPLLSAGFKSLLDKLNSCELLNFEKKVVADLQNWRNLLPKIIALLEDAEEKKVIDRLQKLWLADLKGLADDMRVVIGKFEVVNTKNSDSIAKHKANSRQLRKLVSSWFKRSRFRFDRETASKVKDINVRLQNFKMGTITLGTISFGVEDGERPNKVGLRRSQTSSLLESYVYGRERDKEAVLQMLLNDEGNGDGDSVIPIVGGGGVGKTTLARLVYNDEKLREGGFQLKAWVCVSDDFDPLLITKTILQQVTQENCDLQDLNMLQERLKRKLSGQKFLLVLDDVRNLNYCHWDMLQILFKSGAPGSKIIVTIRDKDVAKTLKGNENFHNIELLPEDACLSMLARHALGAENFDAHPDLKGIGEEIVKKCERLPFSVKIIGGKLRGKSSEEWENVLSSQIWDLPEDEGGILPARN